MTRHGASGGGGVPASAGDPGVDFTPGDDDDGTDIDPADEPDGTRSSRSSSRRSSGAGVPASAGDPGVDVDPETVTGSTTVRETQGTASAEQTIPSTGADSSDPGLAARTIDALTDAARVQNPAAAGAISTTAASLRTESGAPIPGTDRTTPGRRDVDRFRDRLDPATETIDRGIERGVEATTIPSGDDDRERGPIREAVADSGVVPDASGEEIRTAAEISPGFGAAAATLGTEAGRDGLRTGVTGGLQTLNPAAIVRDSATFADAGIRATDTALAADDDEIQAGFDTTAAVAETAREQGPPQAAAAFADDPDQFVRGGAAVGAGAFSLGAAGIAAPTAATRGAGRAARRVDTDGIRRQLDGGDGRSFAGDDRGGMDLSFGGVGRSRRGDGDAEDGSGSLMDELSDELDRMETGEAIRRGEGRAEQRTLERRLEEGRRQERGDEPRSPTRPESRSVTTGDARTVTRGPDTGRSGPTPAQQSISWRGLDTDLSPRESQLAAQLGRETPTTDLRRALDGGTPRDPLDTSGTAAFTRADTGNPFRTAETAGRGVLTGSAVSSQLEGAETGLFETDLTGLGADTGPGVGLGQGTGIDVTPTPDSGTDVGTTPEIGSEPLSQGDAGQQPTGATRLTGAAALDGRQGPVGDSTPTFGDPALGDRTGRPPRRPGRPPTRRPPAVPPVDVPGGEDEEELAFDTDAADAIFDSGIADVDEILDEDDSGRLF